MKGFWICCCLGIAAHSFLLARDRADPELSSPGRPAFQLQLSVIGAGGGWAGNPNHRLAATAGLGVVDAAHNDRFQVISGFWFFTDFLVGIDSPETPGFPSAFALQQNFPNPFNPQTTIRYDLPVPGEVSIEVFTALGQRVVWLVQKKSPAGQYEVTWQGQNRHGQIVANGIYFYRMTAKSSDGRVFVRTRRMHFIK